ncbi:hypothetical protein [Chamaesiphon sp. VAR_69_metabat_338]|uniref:hypothetical protein n=1 Tax=Chamaesiphon sp. VAR_69_metabat_338 TaxID=2964704 RepID=UPI00286DC1D8|nr:hypothetical protein [Chamaesiphon sp. VAR_69_metabat_338]
MLNHNHTLTAYWNIDIYSTPDLKLGVRTDFYLYICQQFQHFQQAAKHERFGSTDAMSTKKNVLDFSIAQVS